MQAVVGAGLGLLGGWLLRGVLAVSQRREEQTQEKEKRKKEKEEEELKTKEAKSRAKTKAEQVQEMMNAEFDLNSGDEGAEPERVSGNDADQDGACAQCGESCRAVCETNAGRNGKAAGGNQLKAT